MHKPLALALALLAIGASGAGVPIDTDKRFEFTDCASGGSAAQTVTPGDYLFRVKDADVALCFAVSASTCVSGGEWFPSGTVMIITIPRDKPSVSCRSTASTGDAIFTSSR
jgi:hypothetical protein